MFYSTAPYALWSCFNFESHRASRTPPACFCVLASYAAGMGVGVVCVFVIPRAICERREPNGRSDSKLEQARSACGCEGVA